MHFFDQIVCVLLPTPLPAHPSPCVFFSCAHMPTHAQILSMEDEDAPEEPVEAEQQDTRRTDDDDDDDDDPDSSRKSTTR